VGLKAQKFNLALLYIGSLNDNICTSAALLPMQY
jgi:hypothetical protein